MKKTITAAAVTATMLLGTASAAQAADPTCAGIVGEVHGHHVVGDYVTGDGHEDLAWPPAGETNAAGGAALPGGPGPGFHFPNGYAPGASFCLGQSSSPGFHLGS